MFDVKAWKKAWRDKNREHIRKYQHDYAVEHPEKILWLSAKNRSKRKNAEFTIKEADIKIPKVCPVFKKPLEKEYRPNGGNLGAHPYAPSLDRIDNTKGYITGNIQVLSNKANAMKSNATPEELLMFAFWIILTYGHMIDKEIS
jgi:hypothetical protein